jgi:hypothetical protein
MIQGHLHNQEPSKEAPAVFLLGSRRSLLSTLASVLGLPAETKHHRILLAFGLEAHELDALALVQIRQCDLILSLVVSFALCQADKSLLFCVSETLVSRQIGIAKELDDRLVRLALLGLWVFSTVKLQAQAFPLRILVARTALQSRPLWLQCAGGAVGHREFASDRPYFGSVVAAVIKEVCLLDAADLSAHGTLLRLVDVWVALDIVANIDGESGVGDRGRVVLLVVYSLGSADSREVKVLLVDADFRAVQSRCCDGGRKGKEDGQVGGCGRRSHDGGLMEVLFLWFLLAGRRSPDDKFTQEGKEIRKNSNQKLVGSCRRRS